MRAAVPAALNEREMLRIVNFLRLRKAADRFREQMCVVRDCYLFGNLWLWLLCRVDDVRLMLDQRPLERFFRAVDIEALAVLPGHVIEKSPDVTGQFVIFRFEVRAFHGEFG